MNEDSISSNADSISSKLAQLKDAINGGDRSLVASLLAAGDIDLEGSIGDTLLHDAVRAGRKEIAEMLLDAGVPIDDAYDKYYYCPVPVCALATPYPDLLQMLIARGANIALGVPRKTTAIATAIWDRHEASLVILLKAGAPIDTSEVCWAAAISVRVIQALLDRGFDLKSLRNNAMGESVGFAAIRNDASSLDVRFMLFNVLKVDINSKNVDGNTCVHHCAEIGSDSRLRWLLAAGADTEIANNLGETPLLTAVRHNFSKCVYSLLAAGADVHAKRDDGLSVLQLALQPVFRSALAQEIVWTLLAVGAQADGCEDPKGQLTTSATADQLDAARRRIGTTQLNFVRKRALEVCIGLQSLRLDALQMCEILEHVCFPEGAFVSFHHWWTIATTVKHFRRLKKD